MNVELQKCFENHSPLVIYPFGVGDDNGSRVIAEGFVYPRGIFFFDVGWDNPMGGYHSSHPGHFVDGDIEGSFPDTGNTRYWKVGNYATIHEVPDNGRRSELGNELAVAKENQKLVERFKDDNGNNRKRAKKVADEYVQEILMYRLEDKKSI